MLYRERGGVFGAPHLQHLRGRERKHDLAGNVTKPFFGNVTKPFAMPRNVSLCGVAHLQSVRGPVLNPFWIERGEKNTRVFGSHHTCRPSSPAGQSARDREQKRYLTWPPGRASERGCIHNSLLGMPSWGAPRGHAPRRIRLRSSSGATLPCLYG